MQDLAREAAPAHLCVLRCEHIVYTPTELPPNMKYTVPIGRKVDLATTGSLYSRVLCARNRTCIAFTDDQDTILLPWRIADAIPFTKLRRGGNGQ